MATIKASDITIGIPVGPRPGHRRWLLEAISSCMQQTVKPVEILIIADGIDVALDIPINDTCRVWLAPWRLGAANGFNHAVALSKTEYVFLLASDDTLEPKCIEECLVSLNALQNPQDVFLYTGVRYMDSGETQNLACGAAMVSKTLWKKIGGYPLECVFGAPDHVLLSSLLSKGRQYGIEVRPAANGKPLYNYRAHPDTEAVKRAVWAPVWALARDTLQQVWEPPCW